MTFYSFFSVFLKIKNDNIYIKIIKKNILFPCCEKFVFSENSGKLSSILPASRVLSDFITWPLGLIKAEIPLFADRAIKIPSSIDL